MNHRRIAAIALLAAAPMVGCGHATKESGKSTLASFPVARAVSDEVTDYEEFPGHLDAFKSVEVRARVGGYLVEALFADGDEVKEGADLFLIDPRPYEAQLAHSEAAVRKTEAHLARLDAESHRANNLFARGAINRQEADRSQGDYAEAKANRDRAKAAYELAKLDMGYTRVTAPISGQIGRRLVDPGTLVRAGVTPLAAIVALDPVYVYLNVDEQTLRKLSSFAKSVGNGEHELTARVGLADQPGEFPYQVTITFSDNQTDAASGTLPIRGALPNPIREDGSRMFVPGMYARVRVPLGSPRQALLVPERALGTDQGRKFLYVVDPENRVVFRPVITGPAHKGMRVIEEGLRPDEQFVAGDVSRIMAGMAISPVPVADPWSLAGDGTGAAPKSAPPFVVPTKGPADAADAPVPRAPAPVLPVPTRGRR